jgi:hypothetical protein
LASKEIAFFANGQRIGTAQTGANGVASLVVPPKHKGKGTTYTATFSGDDSYLGSSAGTERN